ncbi:hypothetical protein BGX26_001445 [Mortierella sp. AD094]|nr:hypothetical protein BGX26_001445 [Mortierella sp. AD094]
MPEEMARVQNGLEVKLRDHATQKSRGSFSFDLTLQPNGLVHPFEGTHFEYPNGCSLRPPFSRTFQEITRGFDPKYAYVFVIPEGTELPDGLVMLHEHSDHYSLQCTRPMPLDKLNSILTTFFKEKCECFTLQEFFDEFPFE